MTVGKWLPSYFYTCPLHFIPITLQSYWIVSLLTWESQSSPYLGLGPTSQTAPRLSSVADNLSSSRPVTCVVPPGSVLGPSLFCIYTRPLEQIIERHQIQYHFYAADTQLYLFLDPCDAQSAMARLNSCHVDMWASMADNFLKLNDDKTELLLIGYP